MLLPYGQIVPKTKYLPLQKKVLGIPDWENAIFVTPLINCASMYSFNELIIGYLYPHSSSLIEIRIKPGSFTQHLSKELIGRVGEHGYFEVYHNEIYYRILFNKNVAIKSITFIGVSFLNGILGTIEDYSNQYEREAIF